MRTLFVCAGALVLASCATPPSPQNPSTQAILAPSPTPDACSIKDLPTTVAMVNDHTRQFDDYAVLASNIVQSQVVLVIPPMQEIRRNAEDQAIPGCLAELKRLQLLYMNSTLDALLAFQSSADVGKLATAIMQSRDYHEQYSVELARLLGVTIVPPTPTIYLTPAP